GPVEIGANGPNSKHECHPESQYMLNLVKLVSVGVQILGGGRCDMRQFEGKPKTIKQRQQKQDWFT
ncbi:hypothetical protein, partial [Siminovitchia fortis]|uniref:hypothetical protein n=1 Tax=Siminovitchia fortis TaxID=254758 RepID=UPI001C94FAB9